MATEHQSFSLLESAELVGEYELLPEPTHPLFICLRLWFLAHTLSLSLSLFPSRSPLLLPSPLALSSPLSNTQAQILSWLQESKHTSYVQGGTRSHMQHICMHAWPCLTWMCGVMKGSFTLQRFNCINNKNNAGKKAEWCEVTDLPISPAEAIHLRIKRVMGGRQPQPVNKGCRERRYRRRVVCEELISVWTCTVPFHTCRHHTLVHLACAVSIHIFFYPF